MAEPRYPSLYQINTRVWLRELSERQGRPATLDQTPDSFLDQIADWGFDWVWPLGIWQTGPAARQVSRTQTDWRREFETLLPDLTEDDITGSPFAVQNYTVHTDFGGDDALARLRERLRARNLRLLLDFVPNHSAPDHAWARQHPEYYIGGNDSDLSREPRNYCHVQTPSGPRILARGRDPYFPGWPDTLQLNYRCLALRQAMTSELTRIAGQCDGVRCDMAMLLLPDVIQRTWGNRSQPSDGTPPVDTSFWPEVIARVRTQYPSFRFMAEVYWDLEWTLQQQGFDYTYDKRLYDRLHAREAEAVRDHLRADLDFQRKSVRFLENHDEPRAAGAFPTNVHEAAAVIAFLVPGMRFFHEGQFEGRRQRVSMHLGRRPAEPVDTALQHFYSRLLEVVKLPVVRNGRWQLLGCRPAWEDNPTWKWFVAFTWEGEAGERLLITVNYGHTQGQCYIRLPWPDLRGRQILLGDWMSTTSYERDGTDLVERGLYLNVPEYHYHVFDIGP
jgi:hypothetical protein